MRTKFPSGSIILLLFSACSHGATPTFLASPAPADSVESTGARAWTSVRIDGSYGAFDMRVPAFTIAPVNGAAGSIVLDSVALKQIERRLTTRMAGVARAEAAALLADETPATPHQPAPVIQPGLLGEIEFSPDSTALSESAQLRVAAAARIAAQLDGKLQLVARVDGTGVAALDAALLRAREVYRGLITAAPRLASREISFDVETRTLLPGAVASHPLVQVLLTAAR